MELIIIAALLFFTSAQAQECDDICVERLRVTISDQQSVIDALRDALNTAPPGGAAGGTLREEIRQCQQDRLDLFAIIDTLKAKLADPEATFLIEEWEKTRREILELRLSVILQQSELIGALSRCFAGQS